MKYKLDDIDKKAEFKVPEGYFEDLPMRIQQRISEEQIPVRSIGLPSWSLAMAASMIAILSFVFILKNQNSPSEDLLADIPQEELIAYLNTLDIDEYDLASTFSDDEELFESEDFDVLDGLELEDGSLDQILDEYNLDEEYLEI